jgi:hypothetical protein
LLVVNNVSPFVALAPKLGAVTVPVLASTFVPEYVIDAPDVIVPPPVVAPLYP